MPQQVRSRARFERVQEATAELVVAGGVESVSTRAIAAAAGIPVASLVWLRGRANPEIHGFCREHSRRMARVLFEVARRPGMVVEGSTGLFAELAFQVTDRLFQVAFERSLEGDPVVIDETIALVSSYLKARATRAGIECVDAHRPSPDG